MSETIVRIPDWPDLPPGEEAGRLERLCERLANLDAEADRAGKWPGALWDELRQAGAACWTLPPDLGGDGQSRSRMMARYGQVAEGSLTAAFILSQHDAAIRRMLPSRTRPEVAAWLNRIREGTAFVTVGISQLTTSTRRGPGAMRAVENGQGFQLEGVMPWVTAADRADLIVTGAVLDDGRQLLAMLPRTRPGVCVAPAFELAALQASCTAEVTCSGVEVTESDILAGPAADVMAIPGLAGTGGLETSALALGQARAALRGLSAEVQMRPELVETLDRLSTRWGQVAGSLAATAADDPGALTPGEVRRQANTLVLAATQAYLTARKGTGFLRSDDAQRWARQALFFLVWSCPTPIAQATLDDLSGMCQQRV